MTQEFLEQIKNKKPMHYKKLIVNLEKNPNALNKLDSFFQYLSEYFKHINWDINNIVDSYIYIIDIMMESRLEFIRSGKYPINSETQMINYNDKELMLKYMFGLTLSQYLWTHHIDTFNFYINEMNKIEKVDNLLEIGAGQGYYLSATLNKLNPKEITIVDISQNSLNMAKELLNIKNKNYFHKINFINQDINQYQSKKQFDLIIMYGVLSCLNNPIDTLKHINSLLSENGILFVFACSNCPTPDHVFKFESPEHIKKVCYKSGFDIINQEISISEAVSLEKATQLQIDIAHALILKKR